MSRHAALRLVTLILLTAAFLRLYHSNRVPPGWRDDEVVETAVHAQIVLEGKFPLYFPQAEGHEPLYHYLSAALIALGGRSLFTVRLLSVFFGLFSLAALYRLARRLFGAPPALLAAAALSVSFWSLMYSRFKLRHISEVGLMLLAFYYFSHIWQRPSRSHPHTLTHPRTAILTALCLSLCLYTYFAARAVPLILLIFMVYLLLLHPELFRAHWRDFALIFLIYGVLAAPLWWAIRHTPSGETRLSIVGRPLLDLLHGDSAYLLSNTRETLGMFAFTGDPEYLYNIPQRPVFEWFGAALFLAGVLVSLWRWRQPRHAFLLIWLVGGLAPAFVSTPAASLSHTIAAQPVVYLLPAIALVSIGETLKRAPVRDLGRWRGIWDFAHSPRRAAMARKLLALAVPCLFLTTTAARDLRDYFVRWPALPEVRYLYRADLHEAAAWLNAHPPAATDLGLSSRNLHQADVTALQLDTPRLNLRPRLFDPTRALLVPYPLLLRQSAMGDDSPILGSLQAPFEIRSTVFLHEPGHLLSVSFENGWTCLGYDLVADPARLNLYTRWQTEAGFAPPPPRPIEILSGSPIPLKIFSHLLNPDGSYLAGDDRLDVDPSTLRPGDIFLQVLQISLPSGLSPGNYPVEIGLYNPVSGERVPLNTGDDHLRLTTLTIQP